MQQGIIAYFEQFKEFGIFLISMMPIVELRGAIPAGFALGINPVLLYFICVVGNMLPVPFILLFIRPIFTALKKTRFLNFVKKIEDKAMDKSSKVQEKSMLGLCAFVAIPLPGTGAWTGAMIAALLNMRFKNALPSIFLGVLISGAVVTAICLLLQYGVFESGIMRNILEFLS